MEHGRAIGPSGHATLREMKTADVDLRSDMPTANAASRSTFYDVTCLIGRL